MLGSAKLLHELATAKFATRVSEAAARVDERHSSYYEHVIGASVMCISFRHPATQAAFPPEGEELVPFMLSAEKHDGIVKQIANAPDHHELVQVA